MEGIVMIAAVDDNMGIARGGRIPWDVPGDRAFFREITMGCPLLVGRRTFDSWGGKPLPGRPCAVWTHHPENLETMINTGFNEPMTVNTRLDVLLTWCKSFGNPVYACGGRQLYEAVFPMATGLILSRIPGDYGCDLLFPDVKPQFVLESTEARDGFNIERYIRKNAIL